MFRTFLTAVPWYATCHFVNASGSHSTYHVSSSTWRGTTSFIRWFTLRGIWQGNNSEADVDVQLLSLHCIRRLICMTWSGFHILKLCMVSVQCGFSVLWCSWWWGLPHDIGGLGTTHGKNVAYCLFASTIIVKGNIRVKSREIWEQDYWFITLTDYCSLWPSEVNCSFLKLMLWWPIAVIKLQKKQTIYSNLLT